MKAPNFWPEAHSHSHEEMLRHALRSHADWDDDAPWCSTVETIVLTCVIVTAIVLNLLIINLLLF